MPTLASNLQFQEYQYKVQVPQGMWRWTTRVDVSQATPFFSIRDIITPFGLYHDRIPIPGTVVTAMANSITDLQSAFAPSIVLSPTTLTFTQTQGTGFGMPQYVSVTNGGTYGSLLSATITSSQPFVQVSPANVSSLSLSAAGQFQVLVDSTNLLAVNSPYTAAITIQDPLAPNSPQVIPVTINIVPQATITLSVTSMNFSVVGNNDGTYPAVPAQTFQITNTGGPSSVLNYQVAKLTGLSPWLVSFAPISGTLNSGASQTVTVVVQATPGMQAGTYIETLRVSGFSTNFYQDVYVTFIVS